MGGSSPPQASSFWLKKGVWTLHIPNDSLFAADEAHAYAYTAIRMAAGA